MNITSIEFSGPYSLLPDTSFEEIYNAEKTKSPGVYLWGVLTDSDTYLINYIVMTAFSVAGRHVEHVQAYLSGKYQICDSEALKRGDNKAIYVPNNNISNYLKKFQELSEELLKQLRCYQIYHASLELQKNELERIESGLIEVLRQADGKPSQFLTNAKISRYTPPNERTKIRIKNHQLFQGLPAEIMA